MKQKLIKNIVLIILLVCALGAFVSYFSYDLTGLMGCKEKRVVVRDAKGAAELAQSYDLAVIAKAFEGKKDYEVFLDNKAEQLDVVRQYGLVRYNVKIQKLQGKTSLVINNYNFFGAITKEITSGETCTLPTRIVQKRIDKVIEDMKLSEAQSEELKNNIKIVRK